MQSPRTRWARANTPAAIIRRNAQRDAEREAMAALLPPVPDDDTPGSVWCELVMRGPTGVELYRRVLYVPARGHRCDQHADAAGQLLTATEIGREVAAALPKRPSRAMRAVWR